MSATATIITIAVPILSFFGGIYFQRWMRERVERRKRYECSYRVVRDRP